jgi:hypothetical protein
MDNESDVLELETKLLLATLLNLLADSGFYSELTAVLLRVEAVSVLSGRPMVEYLPLRSYLDDPRRSH